MRRARNSNRQTIHCEVSQEHASAECLKCSRNASGSSWGPILESIMWDNAVVVQHLLKYLLAGSGRSSAYALRWAWRNCSCSRHRATRDWCCVLLTLVRVSWFMGEMKNLRQACISSEMCLFTLLWISTVTHSCVTCRFNLPHLCLHLPLDHASIATKHFVGKALIVCFED